eukprot:2686313-Pleurochrysis_carterae.AAC.2
MATEYHSTFTCMHLALCNEGRANASETAHSSVRTILCQHVAASGQSSVAANFTGSLTSKWKLPLDALIHHVDAPTRPKRNRSQLAARTTALPPLDRRRMNGGKREDRRCVCVARPRRWCAQQRSAERAARSI